MPSVTAKASSPTELLRDADYFATELIRRSEALHRLRANGGWNQASALARKVRQHARAELERERRRS